MNEMGEVKAGSGNTELERPVMGPGMVWMAYVFGWIGVISVALGCDRKLYYVKQHLNQAFCCAIVTTVSGIAVDFQHSRCVAAFAQFLDGRFRRCNGVYDFCGIVWFVCVVWIHYVCSRMDSRFAWKIYSIAACFAVAIVLGG